MTPLLKKLLIILLGVIIGIAGVVVAQQILTHYMPQQAEIANLSFTVYVDNVTQSDSDLLDWGIIEADSTYYVNLTVLNTGNLDVLVYLLVDGLPAGWTESWTANETTLAPGEVAIGDLNLNIPVSATGSHSWDSWIKVEEA